MRHFNIIAYTPFDDASMQRIFQTILDWWLVREGFDMSYMKLSSAVIAGTMQSNVPRLALQWRVTLPGSRALVSLDRREWCTRSSCRRNYTDGTV